MVRRILLRRIAAKSASSLRVRSPANGRPHVLLVMAPCHDPIHEPRFPSALSVRQIHLPPALPRRLRSTLRVWLPSRWFTPCPTSPALSHAGCTPGISPFEAFPFRRMAKRFRNSRTHVSFFPCFLHLSRGYRLAGHTGRDSWVPVHRKSLAIPPVLGASSAGGSLGLLCLPGFTGKCLG